MREVQSWLGANGLDLGSRVQGVPTRLSDAAEGGWGSKEGVQLSKVGDVKGCLHQMGS